MPVRSPRRVEKEADKAPEVQDDVLETEGTASLLSFPNSVSGAYVLGNYNPKSLYISTPLSLPDLIAFSCDSTSATGTLSFAFMHGGTFSYNTAEELTNTKNIVYEAQNTKTDGMVVTFYQDLSQGGQAQRGPALAQVVGEYMKYLKLDLTGGCLFTVSNPDEDFLTTKTSVSITVSVGTSIRLHMRTDEGYSCACQGENEAQSLVTKIISSPGHKFYYEDWSEVDDSDDYAFTFTIRKEGPNKTPFVTFLANFRVNPNTDPWEIGYLPLKGLRYNDDLTVDGTCTWSKR
ncbi:hypothetical protein CALVIDRAFT_100284 [Calocera viscosa TUFC12733]|uniref:Uncharacterized protein n=1 Tax=Calocera viscosa (strain TUFC12733) TaxID=1330018 RepID=A0A167MKX7_CALVF|nr:hypothetical protein CALVIDRAFT_100284 [Calocera viscosa TUFC12733]